MSEKSSPGSSEAEGNPDPASTILGRVYLCGPITGLKDGKEFAWRSYAIKELLKHGIVAIDPTREVTSAQQRNELPQTPEFQLTRRTHGSGVVARDRFDLSRCDIVLANFVGAGAKVSIGSVGEMFWADIMAKPVIVVRESDQENIHDHDMINEIAGWIVHDLDEAILKAKLLLQPNNS